MLLTFTPVRSAETLKVSVKGYTLSLNDVLFDFSAMPKGSFLPAEAISSQWIGGEVSCDLEGLLTVPLKLPHGFIPWPTPPEARKLTHPAPILVTTDGFIDLPVYEGENHVAY